MAHYNVIYSDVGGTNVRFAPAQEKGRGPIRKYTKEEVVFPAYEDYLAYYLEENPDQHPQMMIIGTAGNVQKGKVLSASNLKMTPPDAEAIQARFPSIQKVKIVNDFTLQAMAIPTLTENQYVSLTPSAKPSEEGLKLVVGPGSGLGTSLLYSDEETGRWRVMDSEAGQNFVPWIDIANPKDSPEKQEADRTECTALMAKLQEKFGTVTIERLVSGNGIANIYEALLEIKDEPKPEGEINAFSVLKKAQAEMTKKQICHGLGRFENQEFLAMKAHDYFFTFLAAQAYNQAVSKKVDEIYFVGGVMADPAIQDMMLNHSPFFQSFLDKTPQIMNKYIRGIKMFIVTERDIAFQGAELLAKQEIEKENDKKKRERIAAMAKKDYSGVQTMAIVGELVKNEEDREVLLQAAYRVRPNLVVPPMPVQVEKPTLTLDVPEAKSYVKPSSTIATGTMSLNALAANNSNGQPNRKITKHLDFTNQVVHTIDFRGRS